MNTAEERPKITASQVLCASVEAGGALGMSFVFGFPSIALLLMEKDPDFEISEEQGSWIGATVPGMALIGSLIAGYALEALGRRYVCVMTSFLIFLSWACLALSADVYQVIAARCLTGFCLGIRQVATSVYFCETVHPNLRPLFMSIFPGLAWFAGYFAINVAGEITDWRGLSWMGATVSLSVTTLLFCLPETPYHLLKSNKTKEALDILGWLFQTEKEAQTQLKDIQRSLSSINEDSTVDFSDMLKPPYRWPFSVAVMIHVFQQTTGITVVTVFMGTILERSGSSINLSSVSFAITIVSIGALFLSAKMLDTYSRKTVINVSSQLVIIPLLAISSYLWAKESGGILQDLAVNLTWVPALSLVIYTFGYCLGWGPLPWLFIGESLPLKIREKGTGLIIATNWAFSFITTKAFSWTSVTLGPHNVYFLFALLTVYGMLAVQFYFPETVGFSDAQLETYYKNSYKKKRN